MRAPDIASRQFSRQSEWRPGNGPERQLSFSSSDGP